MTRSQSNSKAVQLATRLNRPTWGAGEPVEIRNWPVQS